MSFIIKDKDLFNKLFKIAQEAPSQVNPEYPSLVFEGLLENLERNLQVYSEDQFVSQRGNSELYLKNLQSTYQFLLFLQQNGVLFENKPLSIYHDPDLQENDPNQHIIKYKYFGVNPELYLKYPANRKQDFRFWVYKDGVTRFIKSLYDKSKNEDQGGKLLKVLLDRLLVDMNSSLGGNIIDPNKKEAPVNKETNVDGFPTNFRLNFPYDKGNVPLTVGDLDSLDTLKSFFTPGRKLYVIENNQFINGLENICKILEILQKRSEIYKYASTGTPNANVFEYYYQQITSFLSQANCSVSGGSKDDKDGEDGGDGNRDRRQRGSDTGNFTDLNRLISSLPLNLNTINFRAITDFFRVLLEFAGNNEDKGTYQQYASDVSSNIARIRSLLRAGDNVVSYSFDLNSRPVSILHEIQEKSQYSVFLELLGRIVETTRRAILYLKSKGQDISPTYMQALNAQVGYSASSANSIAHQNLQILSRLDSQRSLALNVLRGNQ